MTRTIALGPGIPVTGVSSSMVGGAYFIFTKAASALVLQIPVVTAAASLGDKS